ncbi:MAG TPA: sensor histidine kinase [Streptosporangiaceae bacterium]|jgi:signal transduction histidine kinase|nr:sensor histidine kinase [Streptosporangiaceae bacterium]
MDRMLTAVNWVARGLGFTWIGVLSFVLIPPKPASALAVQVVGYALAGLGLLTLALIDLQPKAVRYRATAWPVILGVVGVAAGSASGAGYGGSIMVVFAFVAALMSAGDTDMGPALAVTAATALATLISGLAFGASYGILVGFPTVVISGLLIGRNRGAYRLQAEQAAMLLAQREQLEAEHRRADLLDERARIAREIHDVLAHSLGALGIQIQAARAVLTDHGDIERASELLATAQRMAADGLVETRRAVHALREAPLVLETELAQASETHRQRHQVTTTFAAGGTPAPLPPDATIALLRVAQESLVNAAKHAAGHPVAVHLDYSDAEVRLTISNDLAPGADADADQLADLSTVNGGYGLTGMRERLRLLNGTLQAGRCDNRWVVTAGLPRSRPEKVT